MRIWAGRQHAVEVIGEPPAAFVEPILFSRNGKKQAPVARMTPKAIIAMLNRITIEDRDDAHRDEERADRHARHRSLGELDRRGSIVVGRGLVGRVDRWLGRRPSGGVVGHGRMVAEARLARRAITIRAGTTTIPAPSSPSVA